VGCPLGPNRRAHDFVSLRKKKNYWRVDFTLRCNSGIFFFFFQKYILDVSDTIYIWLHCFIFRHPFPRDDHNSTDIFIFWFDTVFQQLQQQRRKTTPSCGPLWLGKCYLVQTHSYIGQPLSFYYTYSNLQSLLKIKKTPYIFPLTHLLAHILYIHKKKGGTQSKKNLYIYIIYIAKYNKGLHYYKIQRRSTTTKSPTYRQKKKKKLLWLFIQVCRGPSSSVMQKEQSDWLRQWVKKKTALACCSSMQRPIIFNYAKGKQNDWLRQCGRNVSKPLFKKLLRLLNITCFVTIFIYHNSSQCDYIF
jgi:hypothetical protein